MKLLSQLHSQNIKINLDKVLQECYNKRCGRRPAFFIWRVAAGRDLQSDPNPTLYPHMAIFCSQVWPSYAPGKIPKMSSLQRAIFFSFSSLPTPSLTLSPNPHYLYFYLLLAFAPQSHHMALLRVAS